MNQKPILARCGTPYASQPIIHVNDCYAGCNHMILKPMNLITGYDLYKAVASPGQRPDLRSCIYKTYKYEASNRKSSYYHHYSLTSGDNLYEGVT